MADDWSASTTVRDEGLAKDEDCRDAEYTFRVALPPRDGLIKMQMRMEWRLRCVARVARLHERREEERRWRVVWEEGNNDYGGMGTRAALSDG